MVQEKESAEKEENEEEEEEKQNEAQKSEEVEKNLHKNMEKNDCGNTKSEVKKLEESRSEKEVEKILEKRRLRSTLPLDTIVPSTKKKKNDGDIEQEEYDANDPDYQVWLPPENQTGDGKTALNAKYGY